MGKVELLHKNLLAEWSKEMKSLPSVQQNLQQLEEELRKFDVIVALAPSALDTIHKDFFEINVLYQILVGDLPNFEEAITQVNRFYETQTMESVNKYLMTGLYLMHLLASNRISEFHMLLEQLDQSIQQQNPYINTPVKLEQFLVEGAYHKIMLSQASIPSPYYSDFIQTLLENVRNEIALCLEKSYKRLQFSDATRMLLFEKQNDVIAFGKNRSWKVQGSEFCFDVASAPALDKTSTALVGTKRIIEQNLFYAKQLEMII